MGLSKRLQCVFLGHEGDDKGLELDRPPLPGDKNLIYRGTCERCGMRGYVFIPVSVFPGGAPRRLDRVRRDRPHG